MGKKEAIDLESGGHCDDGKQRILIEIVAARRVPTMDAVSESDPFVKVFMGGKKIHKTKVIENNSNPIWTLETGSLFLLEFIKHEVDLDFDKVSFVLKDYDMVKRSEILGSVDITLSELVKGQGKRTVYYIDVPQRILAFNQKYKRVIAKRAKLVLRFKPPSADELHFMSTFQEGKYGIFAGETFLPPIKSRVKLDKGAAPHSHGWGAILTNSAPHAKGEELDNYLVAAMSPSEKWVEVGSGNRGRVYVEVLACDGLPNLDTPTLMNLNNLTDAYCCFIMEDSLVHTSYIKDSLSPRWLPSDRRAFVFHVHHPSSPLYVGVFDFDKPNRLGIQLQYRQHDPIGRIVIDLTQFYPDTLYTLQYHIYPIDNELDKDRAEQAHNGTITLRLRLDWGDTECTKNKAMSMLVAGMLPPPESYLSVPAVNDFQVAHYTAVGEHAVTSFDIKTMTTYLEELKSYLDQDLISTAAGGLLTVLLWRGHWRVRCWRWTLNVPLHSIVAFGWGIAVTQNYNRLFSFFLFGLAWFFLATNEHRRRHPSPWHKCKSYHELFAGVMAGTFCGCSGFGSHASSASIEANENWPAIRAYCVAEKRRKEALLKWRTARAAVVKEDDIMAQVAMASSANDPFAVATAGKEFFLESLNPLKPILYPLQTILREICVWFRLLKSVVMWHENYYPFWIVTSSLVGSLLVWFIPWGFLFRWIFRIVVWVVLGPWMKIVDWIYFERREHMTDDEMRECVKAELHAQYKKTLAYQLMNQKAKEQSMMLQSMMKYLFGKFVVRVPRFRESAFIDYPLPSSTAQPYRDSDAEIEVVGQICGQTLTGDMIPRRMIQERPFITSEPEEASPMAQNLKPEPKLASNDAPTEGEQQPLLQKIRQKKRKKIFGLFKKVRENVRNVFE